ncbi:MAG: DUF1810 domain-containing protein [Candidatus Eremiobacteraeota bacterium]|nr:DUF1810 domain-containing protein [Candidatus Eremiobacteraeota bacterium]
MTDDPFDLRRFMLAQTPVFATVVEELTAGRKQTHWMWFIFPQLRGLGSSRMAQHYGIGSLDEARAYLAHGELGTRLRVSTECVLGIADRSLGDIFGAPDDVKFGSSMTLFALAEHVPQSIFRKAIERYCNGIMDERTVALLRRDGNLQ